jgi:isoleucyl-tRNA synthetase
MTSLQKDLIKNNQKINWIPSHLKNGRFGEWLFDIKDWNISRERYWGTPLPIWRCQNKKECNNIKVFGSFKELEKISGKKISDPHRPYIDDITFKCEKCGGLMKRVVEVADCWLDSGSMPYAQVHFPFDYIKNKKELIQSKNYKDLIKKISYPADFICEGIDQTRGWFYTLLAVSTFLGLGPSYKNVISLGHVLDEQGQKMSKSKGNVVSPQEVIDNFGADCARFYFYTINQAGEPKKFVFKDLQVLYRKVFDTLINVQNFFFTYTTDKNFKRKENFKSKNLLDKWIISRLNNVNNLIIKNLDNFDIVTASRALEDFIDDLSNWYVRRSRQRFQKPKNEQEFLEASQTLYYILFTLSELMAPFTPFISEYIYQSLKVKSDHLSVHLCDYPKPKIRAINKKLEEEMKELREIVALALNERARVGIKVRQPLNLLKINIKDSKIKNNNKLLALIKEEVNVKEIIFDSKIKNSVELDTKITPELKEEGMVREIIRQIQDLRKKSGFLPKDKILIEYFIEDKKLNNIFERNKEIILKETTAQSINFQEEIKLSNSQKTIKVDGNNIYLIIKKYG